MTEPTEAARLRILVERELPKLKRFFRSKLPEPDCYDVAQETLRAFLSADVSQVEQPAGYLWGIAHKQVARYFDRRRKGEQFDSTTMSVVDMGTTLSVRLDRRNQLLNALRTIPVEEQIAFELRYGEDCSLDEVAEATGVSLSTVKRRITAAREKLAERLEPGRKELSDIETGSLAEAYRDA
jgi:RNA polymerase sigma factor (sigma-70 family)